MNEEIIKEIEERKSGDDSNSSNVVSEKTNWLIFDICGKKYAIKSTEVHEIIRDMKVYKLPFLPSYIEGVINRRGDPFTVINPLVILEDNESSKVPEQPLFLVLKRDDDQISLHISDILLFYEIDNSDLHIIPNNDEEGVFLGTFDYESEEIPALNSNAFEILLRKDLGR